MSGSADRADTADYIDAPFTVVLGVLPVRPQSSSSAGRAKHPLGEADERACSYPVWLR